MVAIFPILDVYFCIATKWTRNMGFLLTYSSLLLKTWRLVERTWFLWNNLVTTVCFRVNLTFRVKSAHKLKLTDKQLLQWLFPILLVMVVYLSAWTLSDPPQVSAPVGAWWFTYLWSSWEVSSWLLGALGSSLKVFESLGRFWKALRAFESSLVLFTALGSIRQVLGAPGSL